MTAKIHIRKSPTADTRTCDCTKVSKDVLFASSKRHINDVTTGMEFLASKLRGRAAFHDYDKLDDIDGFHANFQSNFEKKGWLDRHYTRSRHHLQAEQGVPANVDLLDVIECVVDCVMAGLARSGEVRAFEIPSDVLQRAVTNTAELLQRHIVVDAD